MRNDLRALYESALDFMRGEAAEYSNVSHPLLVSVPDGYAESAVRLMVVGQETHGWGTDRSQQDYLGRRRDPAHV